MNMADIQTLWAFTNGNLVEVLDQNEGVFSRLSIATYPT